MPEDPATALHALTGATPVPAGKGWAAHRDQPGTPPLWVVYPNDRHAWTAVVYAADGTPAHVATRGATPTSALRAALAQKA